jgi:hypothetical protein
LLLRVAFSEKLFLPACSNTLQRLNRFDLVSQDPNA